MILFVEGLKGPTGVYKVQYQYGLATHQYIQKSPRPSQRQERHQKEHQKDAEIYSSYQNSVEQITCDQAIRPRW